MFNKKIFHSVYVTFNPNVVATLTDAMRSYFTFNPLPGTDLFNLGNRKIQLLEIGWGGAFLQTLIPAGALAVPIEWVANLTLYENGAPIDLPYQNSAILGPGFPQVFLNKDNSVIRFGENVFVNQIQLNAVGFTTSIGLNTLAVQAQFNFKFRDATEGGYNEN